MGVVQIEARCATRDSFLAWFKIDARCAGVIPCGCGRHLREASGRLATGAPNTVLQLTASRARSWLLCACSREEVLLFRSRVRTVTRGLSGRRDGAALRRVGSPLTTGPFSEPVQGKGNKPCALC